MITYEKILKELFISGLFNWFRLFSFISCYWEKIRLNFGGKPFVIVELGELTFGAIPIIPYWSSNTV